jgi:predicted nucleotidyltransferase
VASPLTSHPSLDRIARVAEALGDLRDRVVFIGGAIAPLLQTHPPFPRARPTKDVDAVAATTSYRDIEALDQALRARDFRTPPAPSTAENAGGRRQTHVHKWLAPGGIEFDLVPSGAHLGGSGSLWDQYALELAETVDIRKGLSIKHADAPTFLAMKWAAHHDRGKDDPVNSTDLEDILALIASRPTIIDELQRSPPELSQYVRDQTAGFLRNPDVGDLLAAHLNNATAPRAVIAGVRSALDRIAHLG